MAQVQTKNNRVEHPNHYNWIPGIECLDVVAHFSFNLGSAIKYIWRAPFVSQNERIINLQKAVFLLDAEIKRLQEEEVY